MQNWDKSKTEKLDEVSRQTNKRKSTAKWCKGKEGREHTPEIVVNHNWTHRKGCAWSELMTWRGGERSHWKWYYHCRHSYQCSTCGKYIEWTLKNKEECPDFKPKPGS